MPSKLLYTSLLFFFLPFIANSQCMEIEETKVLLVGDSWAFFMGVDGSLDDSFQKWGHSNYKFLTSPQIAVNGAETDDVLEPSFLSDINTYLVDNPSIEIVHLSIGGNDLLGDWHISLSDSLTQVLRNEVLDRIVMITDSIKLMKPGIRIFWSGYVYPNFGEVIEEYAPFPDLHIYYGNWEDMGFPTFIQINEPLNDFLDQMQAHANSDPQIDFVMAPAVLQYTYGQNSPLGLPPGGTYAPFTQPLPYGDPTYPSPKNGMRDWGLSKDCFHLSPGGYRDFTAYQTQKFYHKFFMDDAYFLAESPTKNGSVSDLGALSTQLACGTEAGETFSTVLSFNTDELAPNIIITKASLFLRRDSIKGGNPIDQGFEVRVVNGNFGASVNVDAADYFDLGAASDTPCQFGSNNGNKHWIRLELPDSLLVFISPMAETQFTINALDSSEALVYFSGVDDPDFAPVLNLQTEFVNGVIQNPVVENEVHVYPNPTNDLVFLEGLPNNIKSIQLSNVLGQFIKNYPPQINQINLGDLSKGVYLLSIQTETSIIAKRIFKTN